MKMNKKLNGPQALFTFIFVLFVLSIYSFIIPEFKYKSIIFILVCGVSALVGVILATSIIKDKEFISNWLGKDIPDLKNK